jgi:hypothetical protein
MYVRIKVPMMRVPVNVVANEQQYALHIPSVLSVAIIIHYAMRVHRIIII